MRLRRPKIQIKKREVKVKKCDEIWQQNYQLKIITPIYGGGITAAMPDLKMPIRASAIRGQLRFWWRLLRQYTPKEPLSSSKLFEQEQNIWGGMAEDNKDHSSKIKIRISNVSKPTTVHNEQYSQPGQAYALFPARDNNTQLLAPGITANLQITFLSNDKEEVQWIIESLRWWSSFGGIGARTRRGLGTIQIKSLEPITEQEAELFGCDLRLYPEEFDNNMVAWEQAVYKLQSFRQGKGIGRGEGSDPNKPRKLGRSYWPEPDSIRDLTHYPSKHKPEHDAKVSFPRAAFGMPIIFEIRGNGEPPKTELKPIKHDRMASPIILKAMQVSTNKYAAIALRLPIGHLESLEVELIDKGTNNQLEHMNRSTKKAWWPLEEKAQQKKAIKIKPMKDRGSDAISAFLNYFMEK